MISSASPKVSKIHYSLLILLSCICLYGFSNPFRKNAVNLNPKSIQDKNYQWTEAKAEDTYEKRTPVEDQWYSQYTPKKPGYIRKTDGSFMAGDLEIRYRYNQASEEKVRNSEGNKDFQTLPEKKQKRLTKVEFINEAVNYLNSCE